MKLKEFKNLQEVMYQGSNTEKQFASKSFTDYTFMSKTQNEMYKKLIVGLSLYSKEDLYLMNSTKKIKIKKKHKEAQEILNLFKQEKLLEKTNALIPVIDHKLNEANLLTKTNKSAPNSYCHIIKKINIGGSLNEVFTLASLKQILSYQVQPDPTFLCSMSFKDLGIKKTDIVNKLIDNKLLPINFSEL